MVADLREMQENQGFSENRIDKLEFAAQVETIEACAAYAGALPLCPGPADPLSLFACAGRRPVIDPLDQFPGAAGPNQGR